MQMSFQHENMSLISKENLIESNKGDVIYYLDR